MERPEIEVCFALNSGHYFARHAQIFGREISRYMEGQHVNLSGISCMLIAPNVRFAPEFRRYNLLRA